AHRLIETARHAHADRFVEAAHRHAHVHRLIEPVHRHAETNRLVEAVHRHTDRLGQAIHGRAPADWLAETALGSWIGEPLAAEALLGEPRAESVLAHLWRGLGARGPGAGVAGMCRNNGEHKRHPARDRNKALHTDHDLLLCKTINIV